MDRPLQCFFCGEQLYGKYYNKYSTLIKQGFNSADAIDAITELDLLCCRIMILSHNPRLTDQLYLKPESELLPEDLPDAENKTHSFLPGGKKHLDANQSSISLKELGITKRKRKKKTE